MEQTLLRDRKLLEDFHEVPSDPDAARLANDEMARKLAVLHRKIDAYLESQ